MLLILNFNYFKVYSKYLYIFISSLFKIINIIMFNNINVKLLSITFKIIILLFRLL